MSIRSMVNDFLDKTVEARFKRDAQDRLIFFPWGFGSGRIVADTAVEAQLRRGCRRLMIAIFAVVIPFVAAINAFYQLAGLAYFGFLAGCIAAGFASQLYPVWLSRNLPRSNERISYTGAMQHSLDRFGRTFLVFGVATSALFSATAIVMLAYPPARADADPAAMVGVLLVFAPMTLVYALALWRRRRNGTSAA